MSAFDIVSIQLCTFIYNELLMPVTGKLTRNLKGLSELQRMGIERLRRVKPGEESSSLSIFLQIPQYVLVGASEVFMYIGQLELFNSQAPDGLKSFDSSLCIYFISSGNFFSSFIINIVMEVTFGDSKPSWIPGNLNEGHCTNLVRLINRVLN
ncbi:hypothetical protein MKW92_050910 [Papaver armeniacum]|nr:hypothetical protein MKW92_050910 [Papaver armeniacum]